MNYDDDDDDDEKEFFSEHDFWGDKVFSFWDDEGQVCEATFSRVADETILYLGLPESRMKITKDIAIRLIELLSRYVED